ncbi:MAG TPA: hypothetical protein VGR27_10655 [Longimicrobiaceae bacterium]|nr:hypothetical protein [Longimicrobiaceae bacterium]
MARYGREYRGYDRGAGYRPRDDRRGYPGDYDRGYGSGWGMTGLFNSIMRGPPRRPGRYGGEYADRSTRRGSPPDARWRGGRTEYGRGGIWRSRYDRGWF